MARGLQQVADLKLIAGKTALQLSNVYLLPFCLSAAQFPSLFGSPFLIPPFSVQQNKTKKSQIFFLEAQVRWCDTHTFKTLQPTVKFLWPKPINWIINWSGVTATDQAFRQVQLLHCSTFQFTHFNRSLISWPSSNGLAAAGMWLDSASVAPSLHSRESIVSLQFSLLGRYSRGGSLNSAWRYVITGTDITVGQITNKHTRGR